MSTEQTCLDFRNVSMEFPGVKALSDVTFSIRSGEVHALMGANGAGKSTLIKILARVYHQTHGEILLYGESLSKATGTPRAAPKAVHAASASTRSRERAETGLQTVSSSTHAPS